ncbi:plancitoxin-1-like isoform X2 [Dreissena polymorpha]|nr:plancitoxin-1-like isoform X2 [Dreissena polymorpha]
MMYLDANSPSWILVRSTLDQKHQAIFYTLDEIYSTNQYHGTSEEKFMYAMYNDEPPNSKKTYSNYGHTKGVVSFDLTSGFWLVQSKPLFPPTRASGYKWSNDNTSFGQTFLCVTMPTQYLDEIGMQLMYNHPVIYDKSMPATFADKYPKMTAALENATVQGKSETTLYSRENVKFQSFAKSGKWGHDLYADLLASTFRDSMYVETWQRRKSKMCSNCTGTFKVFNVKKVMFSNPRVDFEETKDHAKWAITTNPAWVCVGDINREESQMKRGGGAVCFQNKQVWSSFNDSISDWQDCSDHDRCVPP